MSMHETNKKLPKSLPTAFFILGILVIGLALFNIWQIYSTSTSFKEKTVLEKIFLPEIELAFVNAPSCKDCYPLENVVVQISNSGVNITTQVIIDYNSPTGKALVEKYRIRKVPALIIKGDVQKSPSLMASIGKLAKEQEGVYVLEGVLPPYVETTTGKIKGYATLTSVTKENCQNCFNLTPLIAVLSQQLHVKQIKEVKSDTSEGQAILKKYNITKVPTLILGEEAGLYPSIVQVWNSVGTIESDGSRVIRNVNPPYYDYEDAKIKGFITLTTIKDSECKSCYNATAVNKPILLQLGLTFFQKEQELELQTAAAQQLIKKYKITKVPTIILTGDVDVYQSLKDVWKDVGTIESDGAHVFRKVELFQLPYHDLEKNEIVTTTSGLEQTAKQ